MSKYQFKLPDIGEGIAEGTIGEWHVKPGDKVEVDGDLVQIENDKSVEEIPSPVSGTVTKILVEEGETAEVGQPLIELEVAEGEGNVADDAPAAETEKEEKVEAAPAPNTQPTPQVADHSLPVLAMPAVRRYAREQGIDLKLVPGSGRHGQVLRYLLEMLNGLKHVKRCQVFAKQQQMQWYVQYLKFHMCMSLMK